MSTTTASRRLQLVPRRSQERGNADHGWLKTFHTFDFSMYQGSGHDQFGALRVLNEDRVAPGTGFGTHGHREFEIFSYVVSGQLEHRDSMGNVEVLKRGDIQMTSAGTGIRHSEKTHGDKEVHFLQIWSVPSVSRLQPSYFTRQFTDEAKKDTWLRVVAPITPDAAPERESDGTPAPIHSPLTLYATLLSPSTPLKHVIKGKRAYVHVVQTSGYNTGAASLDAGAVVRVSGSGAQEGVVLGEGDGLYVTVQGDQGEPAEVVVENKGGRVAEVLLFDLE